MPGIALVVDDEPHIRRAVRNTIEGEFDRVIEAAGALEAVDLAASYRPELDKAIPRDRCASAEPGRIRSARS